MLSRLFKGGYGLNSNLIVYLITNAHRLNIGKFRLKRGIRRVLLTFKRLRRSLLMKHFYSKVGLNNPN